MNGTKATAKAVMNAAEAAISDPGLIAKIEDQRRSLKYERNHRKTMQNESDDTHQDEKAAVAQNNKEAAERLEARKAKTTARCNTNQSIH